MLASGRPRVQTAKVLVSLKSIINEAMRRGLGRAERRHRRPCVWPRVTEQGGRYRARPRSRRSWTRRHGARRALLVTAVFTGLRASEMRGLRWAGRGLRPAGNPGAPAGGHQRAYRLARRPQPRARHPDGAAGGERAEGMAARQSAPAPVWYFQAAAGDRYVTTRLRDALGRCHAYPTFLRVMADRPRLRPEAGSGAAGPQLDRPSRSTCTGICSRRRMTTTSSRRASWRWPADRPCGRGALYLGARRLFAVQVHRFLLKFGALMLVQAVVGWLCPTLYKLEVVRALRSRLARRAEMSLCNTDAT